MISNGMATSGSAELLNTCQDCSVTEKPTITCLLAVLNGNASFIKGTYSAYLFHL